MPRWQVQPYFNKALLDPELDEEELKARLSDRLGEFGKYRDGDPLSASRLTLSYDADSAEEACDRAFRDLNVDERPNGRDERSLSVGDVLSLDDGNGQRWFACESLGWREIAAPLFGLQPRHLLK